jgi:hypothetical protein
VTRKDDPNSFLSRPVSQVGNGLLFLIFFLASVWLQYPGHLSSDSVTVWYEARHAVHFSPHPVTMALILRLLDKLVPGPGLYTIMELSVLWLAICIFVRVTRPNYLIAIALYTFVLVYPPILATYGLLEKDVLSTHLAALACILVMRAPISGRHAMFLWAAACTLTAIASLIRYQFAIVTMALLVWLWWRGRTEKISSKEIRSILAACLGSCILAAGLILACVAMTFKMEDNIVARMQERGNNVGHSDFERSVRKIYVYDIAGIVVGNPQAKLQVFAANHLDADKLKAIATNLYGTDKVDSLWVPGGLFAQLRNTPTSVIAQQWRQSVISSPGSLIRHHIRTFGRLLGLGGVYMCFPVIAGLDYNPPELAADLRVQDYKPAMSTALLTSRYFPVTPLFPAAIYLVLSFAILAGCLKLGRMEGVFLSASGLVYEFTFILLPQSCDVRYSYFMILMSVISAFFLLTPRSITQDRTIASI